MRNQRTKRVRIDIDSYERDFFRRSFRLLLEINDVSPITQLQRSAVTQVPMNTRGKILAGVTVLIVLFAIQLALTSHANTITWDEPDHIYSGYMSWKGDFGLNPEHPPLVKFIATLPLLGKPLNVPEMQDRPYRMQAVLGGREFIFKNDADNLVFKAQMAAAIFSILLLVIAFLTAREMFGTTAGFVALGLLVFDPTLLAHGALVTTDAIQACFLLASIYAFYRYAKAPACWNKASGRAVMKGRRRAAVPRLCWLTSICTMVQPTTAALLAGESPAPAIDQSAG